MGCALCDCACDVTVGWAWCERAWDCECGCASCECECGWLTAELLGGVQRTVVYSSTVTVTVASYWFFWTGAAKARREGGRVSIDRDQESRRGVQEYSPPLTARAARTNLRRCCIVSKPKKVV